MHFCFSSRRRHTRWPRDWSSDVCSSDLFVSSDAAFRGDAELTNPEQLLVLAASSCQMLSFLGAAARASVDVVSYEIGRASCRERGVICGGGGAVQGGWETEGVDRAQEVD